MQKVNSPELYFCTAAEKRWNLVHIKTVLYGSHCKTHFSNLFSTSWTFIQ